MPQHINSFNVRIGTGLRNSTERGHLQVERDTCSHLSRCVETGPGSRRLTNLTPCSWERCWSTLGEGQGDDFSLRKALFVRLHDEFKNDRERGGGGGPTSQGGRKKRAGCTTGARRRAEKQKAASPSCSELSLLFLPEGQQRINLNRFLIGRVMMCKGNWASCLQEWLPGGGGVGGGEAHPHGSSKDVPKDSFSPSCHFE